MSFCVLAKENPFGDIVALEGEFVRTFLKDMPPEFVKLYVFCQYALTNDVRCGSISELASACAVTVESVEAWRGYIDIWLADLKYVSSALSAELSAAPDYFAEAKPAIEAMMAQAGHPVFDADGILQKGVILRHLALPGHVKDSFAVLDQMAAWNDADPGCFIPSVMSQYTPFYKAAEHGIGRRITTYEYRRVVNYAMDKGLVQGYMQQKSSAKEEYTPSFDLTGV